MKVSFFACEIWWGKGLDVVSIEKLGHTPRQQMSFVQKGGRGLRSPSTPLCNSAGLWALLFVFFGINWVLPCPVKELMPDWQAGAGLLSGKKCKKIWLAALICLI